jgi:putative phosphoesterase
MSDRPIITDIRDIVGDGSLPLAVGVLGDTHLWRGSQRRLAPQIVEFFRRCGVRLVVHTGDVNDPSVLDCLTEVAPLVAVKGNNDDAELQARLPLRARLAIGDWRVGVVHGHGGRSAREVARSAFRGHMDIVVFGHSHVPLIEQWNGTVYFNPGSATQRRWGPHCGIGVVRFTDRLIDPHLILYTRFEDIDSVEAIVA